MDDMDDDFMGEIEFDLSPEQQKIVNRAITLASALERDDDAFINTNPLISIMQWWQQTGMNKLGDGPEATLAEACRQFVLAHDRT